MTAPKGYICVTKLALTTYHYSLEEQAEKPFRILTPKEFNELPSDSRWKRDNSDLTNPKELKVSIALAKKMVDAVLREEIRSR